MYKIWHDITHDYLRSKFVYPNIASAYRFHILTLIIWRDIFPYRWVQLCTFKTKTFNFECEIAFQGIILTLNTWGLRPLLNWKSGGNEFFHLITVVPAKAICWLYSALLYWGLSLFNLPLCKPEMFLESQPTPVPLGYPNIYNHFSPFPKLSIVL